jgi:hypothetical protein
MNDFTAQKQTGTSWFSWIVAFLKHIRRRSCQVSIFSDSEGLTRLITYKDGSVVEEAMKWCDVVNVSAFKRDLFAYDLVCLLFEDATKRFEVSEENVEFPRLVNMLPSYLPGTLDKEEWCEKVYLPAFKTNWTTIYSRTNTDIQAIQIQETTK